MESKAQKIVYSDGEVSKAIIGEILAEDDFFLTIKNKWGIKYRIGKRAITLIKDMGDVS